jgi:hypothetical protein
MSFASEARGRDLHVSVLRAMPRFDIFLHGFGCQLLNVLSERWCWWVEAAYCIRVLLKKNVYRRIVFLGGGSVKKWVEVLVFLLEVCEVLLPHLLNKCSKVSLAHHDAINILLSAYAQANGI